VISWAFAVGLASCSSGSASKNARQPPSRTGSTTEDPWPAETARAQGLAAFGREADPAVRARVTAVLRSYLFALAAGDGTAACQGIATGLRAQVAAAHVGTPVKVTCAGALGSLYGQQSRAARANKRATRVIAVRVEGHRAFAIVRVPGTPTGFYPLVEEERAWRVAALGISLLPTQPR
jgi:hypothetical protein